jgi:hypothetical protein
MIDWPNLLANSLWILGLACALAVFSTASWRASVEKTSFRDVLARKTVELPLLACLILFALGVTLAVPSMLEKLAWGALTVLSILQFFITRKAFLNAETHRREDSGE